MAQHKSAKKRIRQTEVVTARNRARRSRIRTFIKRVEAAVVEGNIDKAEAALRKAQSEMMRGVSKGVMKLGTVARKTSRLSAKVKALKQAA